MYLKIEEETKTLEYQEKMNVDVENISSLKKKWIPIYEVIDNSYFSASKIFPTEFLDQCRNNPNKPKDITSEIKESLKRMAMEQGLYSQVVMI